MRVRFTELTATFTAVQAQRASWDTRASEVDLGVQDLQETVKTGLAGTPYSTIPFDYV